MARVCLIVIALVACVGVGRAQPAERPNIVLFLVDDLGWQDTSVPMLAEPVAQNMRWRTPNLERLAARGVRFSDGYASAPVCTPTRTSILTGKSPARTAITYWTLHPDRDTSRVREDLAPPEWRFDGLQPRDHELLPDLLGGLGYRTIHAGKAHFGTVGTPGGDPLELGFDVNIAGHAAGAPASYYAEHHFTQAGRGGKEPHESASVWDVPGLEAYHGQGLYLTEALSLEACRAVRGAVDDGVPFYVNFAPYAVHTPIMSNLRYAGNYPELDERERAYATMIESVDAALGALVTTLEETGQLERTIIVFTSDNGGLSAHARGAAPDGETKHTHNAPARSGKGSAYEGGVRVPWVIAWPGVTDVAERAGTLVSVPVVSQDLFPTVLGWAGADASGIDGLDGRDLRPVLNGDGGFDEGRVIGWSQPHQWGAAGPGIEPFTSIRFGRWKLLYFHAGERFELYDLNADIGEEDDRARAEPETLLMMAGAMESWLDETGGQLSVDKATGEEIASPVEAARAWLGGG